MEFLKHHILSPNIVNLMLEPLLNDCRTLINLLPNCSVTHIFREANRCADIMAKMGADLVSDFQILYELMPVVDNALAFDKAELFWNRLIV